MPHAGAVGHTRHEDERNRGGGRLIAQRREGEIAVHSFHVAIAEDEVGQFLAGNLDANRAVLGFDHVKTLLTQCQLDHFAQPFFVVNNQNFFHVQTQPSYDTHHPLVYKDCWSLDTRFRNLDCPALSTSHHLLLPAQTLPAHTPSPARHARKSGALCPIRHSQSKSQDPGETIGFHSYLSPVVHSWVGLVAGLGSLCNN